MFKILIKNNVNLIYEELGDYLENYTILSSIFNGHLNKNKSLQLS